MDQMDQRGLVLNLRCLSKNMAYEADREMLLTAADEIERLAKIVEIRRALFQTDWKPPTESRDTVADGTATMMPIAAWIAQVNEFQ